MEDNEIVKLFFDRDERAIVELGIKYGDSMYETAEGILKNEEDSEECVNDAYLGTWDSIPPSKPNKLLAYVTRIVRNISLNKLKYLAAKKRDGRKTIIFEELDTMLTDEDCPDFSEYGKVGEIVIEYLRQQRRSKRNVLVRRYFFCDSVQEIAETFELNESTVKSTLMRSRGQLKVRLEEGGVNIWESQS